MRSMNETEIDAKRIKRAKHLSLLLGINEMEAGDESVAGRLSVISKLKATRRAEVARGQAGSWIYDVNRHLNLCAALRTEYQAMSDQLAKCDRRKGLEPVGRPALRLVDCGVKGHEMRP